MDCSRNKASITPSLATLRGSSYEGGSRQEENVENGGHPDSVHSKSCFLEKNKKVGGTEYENIVDALTAFILQFFIDSSVMINCDDQSHLIDTEPAGDRYDHLNIPQTRHLSSMYSSHHEYSASGTDTVSSIASSSVRLGRSSYPEDSDMDCFSDTKGSTSSFQDDSFVDINKKNFFVRFKSRDKYVTIEFKNGNVYEGKMSRYMMEGKGTYTWRDGTQFEGFFKHGVAQGNGYFLWPGKGWYFGEMKDNQRHGKGICVILGENREISYYGRWKNGQRDGKGVLLFGNSNWYDGEWKHDNMHGEGFRLFPTGSCFRGQWKYGKPHGHGTMFWSQNDVYTGMWKRGFMHGKGSYIWKSMKTKEFCLPQKNMYEGSYKKGRRHGPGRLLLACGVIITTYWREDRKEGPGQIICKNGLILESQFLFFDDRIFDVGKNPIIPGWNKWYMSFLRNYQEGIVVASSNAEALSKNDDSDMTKPETLPWKSKSNKWPQQGENHKKSCLNNIPMLAPVETLPLWNCIEMASCLAPSKDLKDYNYQIIEQENETKANEEKWLRKVISNRLPDLNYLYQYYAKLGCVEKPEYDCFLMRLMLWEMCLDCQLDRTCLTLCSLDRKLAYGCYPFDVVPLFEMIYYLLYISFELCMKTHLMNNKIPGLCGAAFDFFITNFALPAVYKRSTLTSLCNWLPLSDLFSFYTSFGSPVTIKKILNKYYWKEVSASDEGVEEEEDESRNFSEPPIFLPIFPGGRNIINCDGKIIFEYDENLRESNFYEVEIINLMELGEELIMDSLLKTYPKAAKIIVKNKDYELSFLEFMNLIKELINEYKATLEVNTEEEKPNIRYRNSRISSSADHNVTNERSHSIASHNLPKEMTAKDGANTPHDNKALSGYQQQNISSDSNDSNFDIPIKDTSTEIDCLSVTRSETVKTTHKRKYIQRGSLGSNIPKDEEQLKLDGTEKHNRNKKAVCQQQPKRSTNIETASVLPNKCCFRMRNSSQEMYSDFTSNKNNISEKRVKTKHEKTSATKRCLSESALPSQHFGLSISFGKSFRKNSKVALAKKDRSIMDQLKKDGIFSKTESLKGLQKSSNSKSATSKNSLMSQEKENSHFNKSPPTPVSNIRLKEKHLLNNTMDTLPQHDIEINKTEAISTSGTSNRSSTQGDVSSRRKKFNKKYVQNYTKTEKKLSVRLDTNGDFSSPVQSSTKVSFGMKVWPKKFTGFRR